jgi:hypothetical protein
MIFFLQEKISVIPGLHKQTIHNIEQQQQSTVTNLSPGSYNQVTFYNLGTTPKISNPTIDSLLQIASNNHGSQNELITESKQPTNSPGPQQQETGDHSLGFRRQNKSLNTMPQQQTTNSILGEKKQITSHSHSHNHIPSSHNPEAQSANDLRHVDVPDASRKSEIPSLLQFLQQQHYVDGDIQLQLSTIAQLLQRQQNLPAYPPALAVQGQHLQQDQLDLGANQQPQPQQRRKRVCKNTNCAFCSSPPCGACESCMHPERRQKCVRR